MKFVEENNVTEFKLNFDNVIKQIFKTSFNEFTALHARMNEDRFFTDDEVKHEYEKFRIDFPAYYCMLDDEKRRIFLKDMLEYTGYQKIEE